MELLPKGDKMAVAAGVVVASATTAAAAVFISKRRTAAKFQQYTETPRGTVLLHQIGRFPHSPSLSPFPIKLETYLRINKIPYKNDMEDGMGPKGKTPWMTFNGEHIADSQLCIEHLNRELGIDMNKHLSPEQRAVARAMRTMWEDHMYWIAVRWRWVERGPANEYMRSVLPLPSFAMWIAKRMVTKMSHAQGMGRHTMEDVNRMAEQNIVAFSDFLGEKKYLMGDVVCEEDCAMFGFLCLCVDQYPGTVAEQLVHGKCSNLKQYFERMKTEFWPDWDDCIGQTL